MQQFLVYRPDPDALQGLLDRHPADALGAVLRLAWLEGLLREEIVGLTWEQVSFLDEAICLADRTVPLYGPMADYLLRLSGRQSSDSRFVVLADRTHQPLQPPSVSRMVRQALDEAGQTRVRLLDLRYDFILRMLESAGWQETSRVSGVELVTLRLHFAGYLSGGKIDAAPRTPSGAAPDEFRLRRLLQEEGTSAAGIVLRLTWLAGLEQQEIAALRWEQVERGGRRLRLSSGRAVPLTGELARFLEALRAREPEAEWVLLSPRSRRPIRPDRLSKLAGTALLRAGLDALTLRDLRMDYALRTGGEEQAVAYARSHGSITRNELMELLGVSKSTAYYRLKRMVERGRLTQVGIRYYPAGMAVPQEEQKERILEYLQAEGMAYRQDIARLLHIEPIQCTYILHRMVEDGELLREKQRYRKKEA
jgi:integrase